MALYKCCIIIIIIIIEIAISLHTAQAAARSVQECLQLSSEGGQ